MRFRNFVNNFSKRNRIYSDEDMYNMSLGNIFDNEDELYSQYQSIGFPQRSELEKSPNVQWVEPYTTLQGNQDGGYYQSVLQPEYKTPVGSIIEQNLPQVAGFDNKNNSSDLLNLLQGQIGIKPDFELGVEKNVYAEPQIQAKQTQPILPQLPQTSSMPSVVQNQNIQNPNINGINQNELSGILERMLKLPYLNNDTNNQYNFGGEKNSNLPVIENIQGFLNQIQEGAKDKAAKIDKDYGGLTEVEKLQKMASKHVSWWVPSEYYGISEYLADDGKMPDKYKKHNEHYKLGDISDERTKAIITSKVQRARKDCPVGPYINTPLEDVDVIVPKDNSDLVKEVKRSDEIAEFIEKNKEKLQAGETVSGSIEFKKPKNIFLNYMLNPKETNDKTGRFTAIHMADIVDAKMNNDGTVTMKVVDYYDFTKLQGDGIFDKLNNRAYVQQELGKLKPFAIYFEFKY